MMKFEVYKVGNNVIKISSEYSIFQLLNEIFKKGESTNDYILVNINKGTKYKKIIKDNRVDIYLQHYSSKNSFSVIPIIQCILRMVSYVNASQNKEPLLCHGSVCFYRKSGMLFGDNDSNSTGKTFLSMEFALKSGKYCVDEYPLIKTNLKVNGFDIPIHIRSDMKKYFTNNHKISLKSEFWHPQDIFIRPSKLFEFKKSGKIDYILYPHFTPRSKGKIIELNFEDSVKSFSYCIVTHMAKFLNPELDKFRPNNQIDKMWVNSKINNICKTLISKYNINSYSYKVCSKTKSFLVNYSDGSIINDILDILF